MLSQFVRAILHNCCGSRRVCPISFPFLKEGATTSLTVDLSTSASSQRWHRSTLPRVHISIPGLVNPGGEDGAEQDLRVSHPHGNSGASSIVEGVETISKLGNETTKYAVSRIPCGCDRQTV